MKRLKLCGGLLPGLFCAGVGMVLSGCGSSNGGGSGNLQYVAGSPFRNSTGTFQADPVPLNDGTARGYVTLAQGVPMAVGVEMTPAVLMGVPELTFGAAAATFVSLPAERATTSIELVAIGYFSAHAPVGVGDSPHFHPIFLLNQVQPPDPPAFAKELRTVNPDEIPTDHDRLNDLAPGIGQAYQDPAQPQNQPNWDSTGQNYFFYDGHMNGIALGATNAFLQRLQAGQEAARSDVIKQPFRYPEPGYYPHRYTVSYDAARQVFKFELSDFQQAQNFVR